MQWYGAVNLTYVKLRIQCLSSHLCHRRTATQLYGTVKQGLSYKAANNDAVMFPVKIPILDPAVAGWSHRFV
jgi:hypothetical protein